MLKRVVSCVAITRLAYFHFRRCARAADYCGRRPWMRIQNQGSMFRYMQGDPQRGDIPKDKAHLFPWAIRIPRSNVIVPTKKHTATLFLFHGSGSNGEDFKEWLDILNRQEFRFPHIKIVYPSAPIQPYTPNGGLPSNVWFDRKAISINAPEIKHSIELICNKASELIHREVSEGIPMQRILIGGYSMGACLSLHLAYRFKRSLAGCIAMSAFLNDESYVFASLKSEPVTSLPELLQFHGTSDVIVPLEWGKRTFENLERGGVKGTFVPLDQAQHEIVQSELSYIKDWILKKLPEL